MQHEEDVRVGVEVLGVVGVGEVGWGGALVGWGDEEEEDEG